MVLLNLKTFNSTCYYAKAFFCSRDFRYILYKSEAKIGTTQLHREESVFSHDFKQSTSKISGNNIISMYRLSFAYCSAHPFLYHVSLILLFIYSKYLPPSLEAANPFIILHLLFSSAKEGKEIYIIRLKIRKLNDLVYKNLNDAFHFILAIQFK